jgi:hypothetical protein
LQAENAPISRPHGSRVDGAGTIGVNDHAVKLISVLKLGTPAAFSEITPSLTTEEPVMFRSKVSAKDSVSSEPIERFPTALLTFSVTVTAESPSSMNALNVPLLGTPALQFAGTFQLPSPLKVQVVSTAAVGAAYLAAIASATPKILVLRMMKHLRAT